MITTEGRTAALFTVGNRCDLCGIIGTTRAVLWSGVELVFCDPHLYAFKLRLTPLTARFEKRDQLNVPAQVVV